MEDILISLSLSLSLFLSLSATPPSPGCQELRVKALLVDKQEIFFFTFLILSFSRKKCLALSIFW
jgi:hypothetical protein